MEERRGNMSLFQCFSARRRRIPVRPRSRAGALTRFALVRGAPRILTNLPRLAGVRHRQGLSLSRGLIILDTQSGGALHAAPNSRGTTIVVNYARGPLGSGPCPSDRSGHFRSRRHSMERMAECKKHRCDGNAFSRRTAAHRREPARFGGTAACICSITTPA